MMFGRLSLGMDTIGAILGGNDHTSMLMSTEVGGVRYYHLVSMVCVGGLHVCMWMGVGLYDTIILCVWVVACFEMYLCKCVPLWVGLLI